MALKPLNSVGGFSVGEIPANVILANADIISNNLTVQKIANLGPVSNVIITGGAAGQYLQTDGLGNLTWTTANTSTLFNGTSNVSIPVADGNVNTSVGGNANVFIVTGTGANVNGYFTASGNITGLNANLGNLATANYVNVANELNGNIGNFSGNVTALNANLGNLATANFVNVATNVNVTGTMQAGNVRTDNLLYANGQPWDLQEAAGSNTQLQYNDGNGNFGASANLTFDYATNVLKVTGNANVTGTLIGNVGNFSGNVTALNANLGNLATANYGNFNNDLVVQGNIANANNISVTNELAAVTGNFSGNITSLNANLGNVVNANYVNINNDLDVNGNMDATFANFVGNVAISNSNPAYGILTDNLYYANGQPWDLQEAAGSNTQIQYNDGNNNFGASANFTFDYGTNQLKVTGTGNITSDLTVGGNANVTGNIVAGNISTSGSGGNITGANVVSANTFIGTNVKANSLLNTQIVYANSGNYLVGDNNFVWNSGSQTLGVTGNANVSGAVNTANINSGASDLTLTANGQNAVFSAANGNFTFPGNVIAGTFYGNVNANVSITAANTSVLFSDSGLIAGATGFTFDKSSNLFSTPGDITVNGAALVTGNANFAGNSITISNNFITGNGAGIGIKDDTTGVQLEWNASSFVFVDGNGVGLEANTFIANLDNTGNFSLPNNLSVFGNISNANNISVTNALNAVTGNFSGNINSLNANLGNLAEANYVNVAQTLVANNANVNLQLNGNTANFTGNVGVNNLGINLELAGNTANFIGNVVLSGPNVTVNNYLSGNTANFSGNITSLNANLGNIADANYIRTQQLYNGSANIDIINNGNIAFSPTVGNVMVLSNLGANVIGYVTANGDGSFGAVKSNTVTAQGGNLALYSEQSGDTYIQLRPYGNGTVDVGNVRITSLATPNASTDAATKQYVDDVAQGLNVHDAAYCATANTLAILTGGTITYNNGTSGVGANLVLSGSPTLNYLSANVFDGNVTAVVGSRILVKSEANAAHNGVYVVDSSTVLTRATDYDTVPEVEAGDFIFVEDGSTYNDSGWVQTSVVTTIGTDPITFTQFSGAGTYQAGAGLTLTGTVFSVNVDNLTTEISGGNVIVKANAQLTTPNIGAATGTSLDLTGNLLAANINANTKITTTDLEVSGNLIAGNISANANLTVNNLTVNLELSGNTANFSGNVIVPNLQVNTTLSGNVANFTGNLTSLNANLGNLAVANYVNVAQDVNVVMNIGGNTANFTGNISAANANLGNLVTANYGNFANDLVVQGNIANANNVSVTNALAANTGNFSGNITSLNANLGNLAQANFFTGTLVNGTSNAGIDGLNGNFNISVNGNANVLQVTGSNANVSGGVNVTGNVTANNFTGNTSTSNIQVNIGTTEIVWGNTTTSSITSNQAIASHSLSGGVTGVEWIVKGHDTSGGKHSMALVTAVTDGSTVDYAVFGTVNLGGTTGTLAVNIVGSNIELQVTPSSTNSTSWTTQFRTI